MTDDVDEPVTGTTGQPPRRSTAQRLREVEWSARTARFALVLAMALWGLQFVANHELLVVLASSDMVVIRFTGVAVCLLLAFAWLPELRPRLSVRDWLVMLLAGALAVPGAQLLLAEGQLYLAPAMAGLVASTQPALTAVLAVVFLGERMTARKLLGTTIALGGASIVVLFASGGGTGLTVRNPWGAALVVGAQLSFSGYTVLTKQVGRRIQPLTLVGTGLLLGTVWLLPLVPDAIAAVGELEGLRPLWFVQLVVGGTLIPYVVWNLALTVLPANETASYIFLVPLAGVAWSWLILREDLSLIGLGGGALIIVGVVLTQVRSSNPSMSPAAGTGDGP